MRELRRHRDPPFAEVTALAELVRVSVADVKQGHFFFSR